VSGADHGSDGSGGAAKLVRMANQIATFFQSQPGPGQAAEVAGHLKAFWEPRMLRALLAHAEGGGEGLSPLAREAVDRLRAP
jgi:formate dehydrogenase subunit delta